MSEPEIPYRRGMKLRDFRTMITQRERRDVTTESVDHPRHYTAHPSGVECIEVTRHCPFDIGNAIKYIWRFSDKSGLEDLRKARWYLKDIRTTGQASHPPHKARQKLLIVCERPDDVAMRRQLLLLIAWGRLDAAIRTINEYEAENV